MRKALVGCVFLAAHAGALAAEQSRDDAWWTGPLLAPGAFLPRGHVVIEPYIFDAITYGHLDTHGTLKTTAAEHDIGSLSYVLFGLTDHITAGVLPRFGYNVPPGASSSGFGVGDVTLQVGYGLTRYEDTHRVPSTALVLQETLPTGRYDRLSQPSDGLGAGAYTTAIALYSQDYFWMPTGRILRARLDVTYAVSSSVGVEGLSVYGTSPGFSGRAYPGNAFTADAAGEYSLTRNWVLALDVVYQHNATTRVSGANPGGIEVPAESGPAQSVGFAPAIEYNWSRQVGAIFGVRIIATGRNTSASVTPALALNMVF